MNRLLPKASRQHARAGCSYPRMREYLLTLCSFVADLTYLSKRANELEHLESLVGLSSISSLPSRGVFGTLSMDGSKEDPQILDMREWRDS